MKIVMADDEQLALSRLERLIDEVSGFEVVGTAKNGKEAIEKATENQADILLLDIRMPGMDGIEAASHLSQLEKPPAVIFTTAYDEHAIEAFRVQAIGYLLKPIQATQLEAALRQAQQLKQGQLQALKTAEIIPQARQHICALHLGRLSLIPIKEVTYCTADNKYTEIHSLKETVLVDESLKSLEQAFPNHFLRIHRSTLVGIPFIQDLTMKDSGEAELRITGSDVLLSVSRRQLPLVKECMKHL